MGWFLPFIAFATIDIYFCIFSMLPMCNIGMWIQYKCDPKRVLHNSVFTRLQY